MLPYIPVSRTQSNSKGSSSLNGSTSLSSNPQPPKKPLTVSATTRARWDAAPTAHRVMLDEARRALSTHQVSADRLLILPREAPNSARPLSTIAQQRSTHVSPQRAAHVATAESLLTEEEDQRVYWLSREAWSREVCSQLARVEWLDHVLQPQIDRLLVKERAERSDLMTSESEERQKGLQQSVEWKKLDRYLDDCWRQSQRLKSVERVYEEHQEEAVVAEQVHSSPLPKVAAPSARLVYPPQSVPRAASKGRVASAPRVYANEAEAILERYQQMHEERLRSDSRGPSLSVPRYLPSPPPTAPGRLRGADANANYAPSEDLGLTKPTATEETTTVEEDSDSTAGAVEQRPASAVRPPTAPTAVVPSNQSLPPASRRRSRPPVAPIASTRSHSVVSLDMVLALLNQHTYFARQISELEESERSDLQQECTHHATHAHTLAQRRMHLERLEYWRNERDARRALDAQLARIQAQMQDTDSDESLGRQDIVSQQCQQYQTLTVSEFQAYHIVEQKEYDAIERNARAEIHAEWFLSSALDLLSHLEGLQRHMLLDEREQFLRKVVMPKEGELQALQRWSLLIRDRCILIQRWVKKIFLGLAGWRRTHRQIGDSIQQMRGSNRVLKQKAKLQEYQKNIQEEIEEAIQDIAQECGAQQLQFFDQETSFRRHHETHEGWMREALLRQCKAQISGVFVPRFIALLKQEVHQRAVLEVLENEERARDIDEAALASEKQIADVFMFAHDAEPQARSEVETQYTAEMKGLVKLSIEGKLHATQLQLAREKKEAQARADVLGEAEVCFRKTLPGEFSTSLAAIFLQHQCDLVTTFALSDRLSGRLRLFRDWEEGFAAFAQQALLREHIITAYALLHESRETRALLTQAHFTESAVIIHTAASEKALGYAPRHIYPRFVQEKEAIEILVERRHRACLAIQKFFRSFLRGQVGRSGMKAHLRVKFAEKRERWEHQQKVQQQRDDVQALRDELEKAIAEHHLLTAESYQEVFQHMANKLEPRNRNKISESEKFIRQIIKRNFEHEAYIILNREHFELLQHESYRRVEISSEWQKLVEKVWSVQASNLVRDVSVRPMQRAWRCYKARKERRLRATAHMVRLQPKETWNRLEVELAELGEGAVDVWMPQLSNHYATVSFYDDLASDFHALSCATLGKIDAQEASERCQLLWVYQLATAYRTVSEPEREARYELQQKTFSSGGDVAQHLESERVQRTALEHERQLVLLRLVALQELEQRQEWLQPSQTIDQCASLVDGHWEPIHRQYITEQYIHRYEQIIALAESSLRLQIYQRLEEQERAQIVLASVESVERCEAEDRGTSLTKWYLWLCDVQQARQRLLLEDSYQYNIDQATLQLRNEPKSRCECQENELQSRHEVSRNVLFQMEKVHRNDLQEQSYSFFDEVREEKYERISSKIIQGGTRTMASEMEADFELEL